MTDENLYDVLGIPRDASEAEIKRAYKRKASATHPDKAEPEKKKEATVAFQKVHRAYALLSDRSSRKKYDETGEEIDPALSERQQLMEMCASLISQVVDTAETPDLIDTNDIIEVARNAVRGKIADIQTKIDGMHAAILKREKVIKRVRKKSKRTGNDPDIITGFMLSGIKDIRQGLDRANEAIVLEGKLLVMLEDYQYIVKPPEPTKMEMGGVMFRFQS